MKLNQLVLTALLVASTATAFSDDLLGENRGSGGGGTTVGSGGSGNTNGNGGGRGNGNGGSKGENRGSNDNRNDRISSESRTNDAPVRVESRGRTGTPRYSGNNNLSNSRQSRSGSNSNQPIRVQSFHDAARGGELARQARTEEEIRRGWSNYDRSSFRNGYYNSWDNWTDNRFCYPHYAFAWNPNQHVVSPFYGYTHVPGYISQTRIKFGSFWLEFNDFQDYRYDSRSRYDRNDQYSGLNNAVNDLTRAFTRRDLRALDRLVPTRDTVRVRGDWAGDYTLGSDDFYDMMRDVVTTTQTRIFSIKDVEYGDGYIYYNNNRGGYDNRNRRDYDDDNRSSRFNRVETDFAIVRAEHHFQDGWRRQQVTELEFVLERDRRGAYQIIEFSSYGR